MFLIIAKKELNKDVTLIVVQAAMIAKKAQAGQFIVLIVNEQGERIPLTLADWEAEKGTITLIFQKVGRSTIELGKLNPGDSIAHILGPLGHPTEVSNLGTIVCIGGGVGIAEVYPVSRAFKNAGNNVIGIIGSRNKGLLILEEELKKTCNELFITTDDGSYARKGLVLDVLKELFTVVENSTHTKYPELVYCIGPVLMMKAVADFTKLHGVKTIVSVNPIMVDATGMCASCRCTVGGKTVYGCVDGPDFDAHKLDFDELQKRLRLFKEQEKI
ncbi:MAG: sulfide/dihydroorotate dehydrogenase-like FAD/NAD-binding protein [Candidatus Omnitrophica bacterium]|nr:sulfide/dihydroorotate dehydrogenase-like FAD/NAD-binding protein [Candidatus Omnitrophota bacterium]